MAKLCLIVIPFSGLTAVEMPAPGSRLRIPLTEPFLLSTGVPVGAPDCTNVPVTPKAVSKSATGILKLVPPETKSNVESVGIVVLAGK